MRFVIPSVPTSERYQVIYTGELPFRVAIVKKETKTIVKLFNTWKFPNTEQARKEAT